MPLSEEHVKYQRLLRELVDCVFFILDADGIFTYLSPSIKKLTGYTPEEFQTHYLEYITDHPQNKKAIEYTELSLKGIRPPKFLVQYFHKDGHRRWFEAYEFPVLDERENCVSVEGIAYDVTDRIKLEEQLTQAKEEAERANQSKSEFLARMSHELRTPLNAIIGFSQVVVRNKAEPLTESQSSDIQNIHISGKHLLKLINEMLELSHIESGTMDLFLEPVNICRLIEEVMELMEPLSKQSCVTVINEFNECDDLYTLADQIRLKQVLLNLVSNAIKYTPESGSVTLSFKEQGDGGICISVTDTGLGIPEEKQAFLFQPFIRLHEGEIQREGTGIGLVISKNLIELMNGRIGYTSQAGLGSCFYIELPLCDPPTLLQEDEITIVERVLGGKREGRQFTVLYIEDHSINLMTVRKFLRERPNIKFLSAPKAKLGLELARSHSPDLILMDIDLPGMDGIEATEYLQNSEETRQIPVIAVSANAMPKDIDKAMNAGFKEYITKPIDMDHFLKTIDQYLH